MSESTATTTELTSQYSAQVTGDLDRNTKEQERIGAEIEALQAQLGALRHDHNVLVSMQQALGVSSPALLDSTAAQSAPEQASAAPKLGQGQEGRRRRHKENCRQEVHSKSLACGGLRADPRRTDPHSSGGAGRAAVRCRNLLRAGAGPSRAQHQDHRRAHYHRRTRGQESRSPHQAGFVRFLYRCDYPRAHCGRAAAGGTGQLNIRRPAHSSVDPMAPAPKTHCAELRHTAVRGCDTAEQRGNREGPWVPTRDFRAAAVSCPAGSRRERGHSAAAGCRRIRSRRTPRPWHVSAGARCGFPGG